MRDDIAGPQSIGDLIHADRRVADVHHDRRARRFAGLDRQAQRLSAVLADGFFVQADFDADADVAVIADRLRQSRRNRRNRRLSNSPGSFNTPCCASATKPIMRVFDCS